ncbi:MAG: tetraacyldisaccharide 4'-kinase [Planctomycetes bacterium]|nr:tetraacyldisaccharide 4'-kinase [Planctomycetota bacterium]
MTPQASPPRGFQASDRWGAWLAVISSERRGPAAALARAGLALLAGAYRAGLAARNTWFRLPGTVVRAVRPVVSVGNLTVGGTGKTPFVAYLARMVQEMGGRPVILSRGYGAAAGGRNEEALELSLLCPGVPHVQNPDRTAALAQWAAENPCDVAILDDGFQHRRLARGLDIVLIDALRPFGFGHLLPRGLLREPPSALRRADVLVITRADLAGPESLAILRRTLAQHTRQGTPVLAAHHEAVAVLAADGSRRDIATLRRQDVAAACGIGNSDAFLMTLERTGARVALSEAFPDHHAYTQADLDRVMRAAEAAGLKTLVTTGKDFVKWQPLLAAGGRAAPLQVAALEVRLRVAEGEDVLRRKVGALLRP